MRLPPIRIRTRVDDATLEELYADREPFHWAGDGSEREPLAGVSVFGNDEGPHWHYVGFGLRGRGLFAFELTFRLAAEAVDDLARAPRWPIRLLNEFARHAIRSRRPFEPGHYLCLPQPVDPDRDVRCGALVPDPQLCSGEGDPRWLQIVGLHERELAWMSGDGYRRLLAELRRHEPLLVTVPGRQPRAPR
jgi:hypothetical protein